MKKALCLLLAAALTLTLWACGAPETAIQKLESPPAAQDAESSPAAELPDEPPAEAPAQPSEPPEEAPAPVAEPEPEPEPEPAAEEALPEELPAEPAAAEEIVEEAAEPAAPEEIPVEEPPAAEAAGESASDHAGHSQSSAGVTVPASEQGENLVWIPTNGGTKYHTSAKCCNMKNPIQVTLETALANGFTPCKRCH